ncbi:carboxyvinyl-carboxyphosphonate phosphorylmutase [Paracoccus pantotrophus]|uniref:Putative PEP phosphonomutase n=1 Tax=Paracoccus pantotrophus TaxID=82367 RepID=Q3S8F5_PARPN|nr:oxaloacetate decarboxylase [Paracoccus pantotrophus]AAZ93590.1 putative PEP phosphonomutase [Paracoccus pantotrophus]RDD96926.1 carboxyvinyl-carboxyphosphonate phosphorylmutase [Paracoccus pantotrophus]WGR66601.1 oxaloacetate decarboxylase [Paracoccus pantotrophus]
MSGHLDSAELVRKDRASEGGLAERRKGFRALVEARQGVLLPGAANALTARVIENLGFQAVYLTGAGLTNTHLGMPDLGLIAPTEIAETASRISDVCALPLVIDIDTGFGNALNTYRTVQMMERAGAAALQLEDQIFPKKCGHFSGKGVVPMEDMTGKLKACLDARTDPNLMIIARTDARAVLGIEAALERAHIMAETGADIIFVEAPRSVEEIRKIGALPKPQLMNIVMGGLTPMLSLEELREAGFSLVLYANAALQASVLAMNNVLGHLQSHGSLHGIEDQLASFEERQRVVRKDYFDALDARYKQD